MNTLRQVPWCGRWLSLALVVAVGLGLMTFNTGCSDHRISAEEFLTMSQEARTPQTQPARGASARQAMAGLIDESLGRYTVGPGDVLSVVLTTSDPENPFPPVRERIDEQGEIELLLCGPVHVAGQQLGQVEETVRKAYVPKIFKEISVSVEVAAPDVTRVLVTGAVETPGLVPLLRTERNLLYAIVKSGGVTEQASGQATLRRIRRPNEEVTLDLTDPVELKGALALDPLENGDVIKVRAAVPNMVFVGGLVNNPRPQVYPQGVTMTVLQALAASGGLRTDVTPKEATLIRRMANGNDVHVKLDLTRISKGQATNLQLAAGDILWVPHTIETRVQEWVNRNIFFRAGVSATYNLQGTEDFLHADVPGTGTGRTLADQFDPFGQLLQNTALQSIGATLPQGN